MMQYEIESNWSVHSIDTIKSILTKLWATCITKYLWLIQQSPAPYYLRIDCPGKYFSILSYVEPVNSLWEKVVYKITDIGLLLEHLSTSYPGRIETINNVVTIK